MITCKQCTKKNRNSEEINITNMTASNNDMLVMLKKIGMMRKKLTDMPSSNHDDTPATFKK